MINTHKLDLYMKIIVLGLPFSHAAVIFPSNSRYFELFFIPLECSLNSEETIYQKYKMYYMKFSCLYTDGVKC